MLKFGNIKHEWKVSFDTDQISAVVLGYRKSVSNRFEIVCLFFLQRNVFLLYHDMF